MSFLLWTHNLLLIELPILSTANCAGTALLRLYLTSLFFELWREVLCLSSMTIIIFTKPKLTAYYKSFNNKNYNNKRHCCHYICHRNTTIFVLANLCCWTVMLHEYVEVVISHCQPTVISLFCKKIFRELQYLENPIPVIASWHTEQCQHGESKILEICVHVQSVARYNVRAFLNEKVNCKVLC